MGLVEKRALKDFQENQYPKFVSEINALAGFELEMEVNWDKMALEDYSHLYVEGFSKIYFEPIIGALKEITKDDLGKNALKETVNKIVITNENDHSSSPSAFYFNEKTLKLDHQPFTNIDNIDDRTNGLATFLMKQM
jgi:hypothetical protein